MSHYVRNYEHETIFVIDAFMLNFIEKHLEEGSKWKFNIESTDKRNNVELVLDLRRELKLTEKEPYLVRFELTANFEKNFSLNQIHVDFPYFEFLYKDFDYKDKTIIFKNAFALNQFKSLLQNFIREVRYIDPAFSCQFVTNPDTLMRNYSGSFPLNAAWSVYGLKESLIPYLNTQLPEWPYTLFCDKYEFLDTTVTLDLRLIHPNVLQAYIKIIEDASIEKVFKISEVLQSNINDYIKSDDSEYIKVSKFADLLRKWKNDSDQALYELEKIYGLDLDIYFPTDDEIKDYYM